jgi:hypothetical protein
VPDLNAIRITAPWDAYWGQRYALLGDPDGVRVNLYAALR